MQPILLSSFLLIKGNFENGKSKTTSKALSKKGKVG
jgi:hypothetical protein